MIYKLHHAHLELKGDIPCYKVDSENSLKALIITEINTNYSVLLVSLFEEVYVTDNLFYAVNFIEKFISSNHFRMFGKKLKEIDIFMQEFESFEDAYKVALSMNEYKDNCYNNGNGMDKKDMLFKN